MTNKEKYKQAFSVLYTSRTLHLEVLEMKRKNKQLKLKKLVASIAICSLLIGSTTIAYAANIGGIQRIIQLWFYGDQTEATIQLDGEGHYSMTYTDDEGQTSEVRGGGVAFGADGKEIPLTDEEIMEHLTAPQVEYREDDTIWVYWFDQVIEITDKFENEVCYVKLEKDDEVLYMTVKYQDGYLTSPDKYLSPVTHQ